MTTVLVPPERVQRWFGNFEAAHGPTAYSVVSGALRASAADGSTAVASLPFDGEYDGLPDPEALRDAAVPPARWGVLLVRKGGFAVARLHDEVLVDHKIGQRHVQGRTKAGGQSQQRFARRRENQARAAYQAAADHAVSVLCVPPAPVSALVAGGDRSAVASVLADPRLSEVAGRRVSSWLAAGDPRRSVLDSAIVDARSLPVAVTNVR